MPSDFITKITSSLTPLFRITFACLLLVSLGCGKGTDGPQLYSVTGTATFDGSPIETGKILFRSAGAGKGFAGDIVNGEYKLEAEAGEMKVEITASRIIPGKFDNSNPDDDPQPVGEMYIPAKYNTESELKATVKADGENTIPFELAAE